MPRVLKAYNTDYKISVQDGGKITLDTGIDVGEVIITGDLIVQGETTTVNTTDLAIEDNTIVLNKSETGNGVTEGTSGIEIDRGDFVSARWVYDESVTWNLGGLSGTGTFYAEQGTQKLPLNTPGIRSDGTLYVDTGAGVISVTGTQNYEEKIFNYENGTLQPQADGTVLLDDDNIPNAKAVVDFIDFSFGNIVQSSIREGNTVVTTVDESHVLADIISVDAFGNGTVVVVTATPHGFVAGDTVNISDVEANGDAIENLNQTDIEITQVLNQVSLRLDAGLTAGDVFEYIANSGRIEKTNAEESEISVQVEGDVVAQFFNNRTVVEDLEIEDATITNFVDGSDLVLQTVGSGSVKINDTLELAAGPWETNSVIPPALPSNGVKIYTTQSNTSGNFSDQTLGKSGIFFVNSNQTRDELVSRNRSLLYSMLF